MPISQDSNRLSGENSYEPPLTSMKSTSSFVAVAVAENMCPMYVDCSGQDVKKEEVIESC